MRLRESVASLLHRFLWPFETPQVSAAFVRDVEALRAKLSDGNARFLASPVALSLARFPELGRLSYADQLMSDHGMRSDIPDLEREFADEVRAIADFIDAAASSPVPSATSMPALRRVTDGINRTAHAMSLWDDLAVPFRLERGCVVQVRSPHDLLGTPTFSRMPIEEFITLSAARMATDRFRMMQLEAQRRLLLVVAVLALAALIVFL